MCDYRSSALFLIVAASCIFFCGSAPAAASTFSAQVVKVADGDSLEVISAGQKIKLRLWGIDAPELRQTYGKRAKMLLAVMVKGRRVEVQSKDVDIYNRLVALVWVDGSLVNEELVRQGAAWVYNHFCRENICNNWQLLQENARREQLGLWASPKPIPPWRYRERRGHKIFSQE